MHTGGMPRTTVSTIAINLRQRSVAPQLRHPPHARAYVGFSGCAARLSTVKSRHVAQRRYRRLRSSRQEALSRRLGLCPPFNAFYVRRSQDEDAIAAAIRAKFPN